ncbi:MAG: urea ABC transporter substrate-binding protein [Mariprofundales bacterium]
MKRFLLLIPLFLIVAIAWYSYIPNQKLPIRVGILHSLSGSMAISERPVVDTTLLAIEQINAAGGILGRKIEAIIADGASDENIFAEQAERLITEENVQVIFGCWTSSSRKRVREVVEKHRVLLIYPLQYEGLEQSRYIVYTGSTPNQQLFPALHWSLNNLGKRVFLIGSDYIFPHIANKLMRMQIKLHGGQVVGEHYLPLNGVDEESISSTLDLVRQSDADFIINTVNGNANLALFSALKGADNSNSLPVMSFSLGANLIQRDPNLFADHYVAWNYMQSIDSPENRAFVSAFQKRFGTKRVISDPMQTAWVGVNLWAQAVRSADTEVSEAIRETIRHQSMRAPEGVIAIDHATMHTWKMARVAQINADGTLREIWHSSQALRPDPFPSWLSRQKAQRWLDLLYKQWDDNWTAPHDD